MLRAVVAEGILFELRPYLSASESVISVSVDSDVESCRQKAMLS